MTILPMTDNCGGKLPPTEYIVYLHDPPSCKERVRGWKKRVLSISLAWSDENEASLSVPSAVRVSVVSERGGIITNLRQNFEVYVWVGGVWFLWTEEGKGSLELVDEDVEEDCLGFKDRPTEKWLNGAVRVSVNWWRASNRREEVKKAIPRAFHVKPPPEEPSKKPKNLEAYVKKLEEENAKLRAQIGYRGA